MKTPAAVLCLAVLVSACSSPPSDPTQAVVATPVAKPAPPTRAEVEHALISKALRKQLDNPARYQPVSFALDGVWTQADSVSLIGLTSAISNPGPYKKADAATVSGHRYQHSYRATNPMGGLVLMDKTVVVYPNDSVVVMNF